jgi:hypothetical protein
VARRCACRARPNAEFRDEARSAYSGSRGPGLAAAKARAAELAATGNADVVLLAFATDRFARADGRTAMHLVEHVLDGLKAGYRVEAVSEDIGGSMNLVLASLYGQRAHADSAAKSAHVRRGKRATQRRVNPVERLSRKLTPPVRQREPLDRTRVGRMVDGHRPGDLLGDLLDARVLAQPHVRVSAMPDADLAALAELLPRTRRRTATRRPTPARPSAAVAAPLLQVAAHRRSAIRRANRSTSSAVIVLAGCSVSLSARSRRTRACAENERRSLTARSRIACRKGSGRRIDAGVGVGTPATKATIGCRSASASAPRGIYAAAR